MFGLRIAVLATGLWISAPEAGTAANVRDLINHAAFAELAADDQIHAEIVKAQVLLDRASISPGEINGRKSENLIQAVRAFAEVYSLSETTHWSDEFWRRLTSSVSGPVIVEHTLQVEDVKGPFIEIPERLEDMIGLKALGYSSPREALAENFHMSEELLATLNPDASFQVGDRILVANIRTEQTNANAARITRLPRRMLK
jgi:peptidoglycan hydrolase-like protein with peptidoglycan-binding domain